MRSRLRILVSGMIAGDPHQGGATWAVLQYVLGLRGLGHEVYFVEPLPPSAVRSASAPLSGSVSAAYFRDVVARFDLGDRATLEPPARAKLIAVVSLSAWMMVIVCGRLLTFYRPGPCDAIPDAVGTLLWCDPR